MLNTFFNLFQGLKKAVCLMEFNQKIFLRKDRSFMIKILENGQRSDNKNNKAKNGTRRAQIPRNPLFLDCVQMNKKRNK